MDKYILQFRQMHFSIQTNVFYNSVRLFLQLGQIHFTIQTNTFYNSDKYIWQIWTPSLWRVKAEQNYFLDCERKGTLATVKEMGHLIGFLKHPASSMYVSIENVGRNVPNAHLTSNTAFQSAGSRDFYFTISDPDKK